MTTYEPADGSIVHIELYADDRNAARSFYENVFDWEFERDEEMDYLVWRAPDQPGGAIVDTADAPFPAPPTLCYVGVDDLSATTDAVEDAGGELLGEETEVPEMGAFVVFRAPGDVVAAAWESRSDAEASGEAMVFTDEPEAGSIVHFELYSTDPAATRAFFESVFDWRFDRPEDGDYTMAYPPTPPYGGLMAATDKWPAGVLLYVGVPAAEAACEAIVDAGGEILADPFDVEGHGTMAVFEAPGGVVTAVWESTAEQPESASTEVEDRPAP